MTMPVVATVPPINLYDKLVPALIKAQSQFTPTKKTGSNPHFRSKYTPLEEIVKMATPILAANGLAISQFARRYADSGGNNEFEYITRLLHSSGQFIECAFPLPTEEPQKMGSRQTYYRRYGYCGILSIVGETDEDANAAQAEATKPKKAPPKKPKAEPPEEPTQKGKLAGFWIAIRTTGAMLDMDASASTEWGRAKMREFYGDEIVSAKDLSADQREDMLSRLRVIYKAAEEKQGQRKTDGS